MRFKKNTRHLVDILFVLGLFAAFALCCMFLILLGTHLYEKNVDDMNKNYASRTSYCYFTEKLRQSDYHSNIYVNDKLDRIAICIEQDFQGSTYITYLYEDDGYLKEYFTRAENSFSPQNGTSILHLSHLSVREVRDHLFQIQYYDEERDFISLYINTVS